MWKLLCKWRCYVEKASALFQRSAIRYGHHQCGAGIRGAGKSHSGTSPRQRKTELMGNQGHFSAWISRHQGALSEMSPHGKRTNLWENTSRAGNAIVTWTPRSRQVFTGPGIRKDLQVVSDAIRRCVIKAVRIRLAVPQPVTSPASPRGTLCPMETDSTRLKCWPAKRSWIGANS